MEKLFNDNPLAIDKELAVIIGLNEALILQQVHYWLKINEKNKRNCYRGKYWTYNTINEWQEKFPFWSTSTVKRVFKNLRDMDLIIVDNFNVYQLDRTLWYTINYEELERLIENHNKAKEEALVIPEATNQSRNLTSQNVKERMDQLAHAQDKINYEQIIKNCEIHAIDKEYQETAVQAIGALFTDTRKSRIIKIGDNILSSAAVQKDLKELNFHVIDQAVNKLKGKTKTTYIKNHVEYLKVLIYESLKELNMDKGL